MARSYRLLDAEAQHARFPATFEIPDAQRRASLQPGDVVKVVFLQGGHRERMWVRVTGVSGRGRYVGRLDDVPAITDGLKLGDTVHFTARNVIDTQGGGAAVLGYVAFGVAVAAGLYFLLRPQS